VDFPSVPLASPERQASGSLFAESTPRTSALALARPNGISAHNRLIASTFVESALTSADAPLGLNSDVTETTAQDESGSGVADPARERFATRAESSADDLLCDDETSRRRRLLELQQYEDDLDGLMELDSGVLSRTERQLLVLDTSVELPAEQPTINADRLPAVDKSSQQPWLQAAIFDATYSAHDLAGDLIELLAHNMAGQTQPQADHDGQIAVSPPRLSASAAMAFIGNESRYCVSETAAAAEVSDSSSEAVSNSERAAIASQHLALPCP
jgi:hypothetical protein